MRKDDRIVNFEGVEQSPEDLQRKFVNSVFEFYVPETVNPTPGKIVGLGPNTGNVQFFRDGKFGNPTLVSLDKLAISREQPNVNLVVLGKTLYSLNKQAQRQWQRGTNMNTFTYERLFGPQTRVGPDVLFASAFVQRYATKEMIDKAILEMKKDTPIALRPSTWMVSTDGFMMSLYYEDMFIGMFNRDRDFVVHSETETLAEEMIHELRLRTA